MKINKKYFCEGSNISNVLLLHHTPIFVTLNAIRNCYKSEKNSDSYFLDFLLEIENTETIKQSFTYLLNLIESNLDFVLTELEPHETYFIDDFKFYKKSFSLLLDIILHSFKTLDTENTVTITTFKKKILLDELQILWNNKNNKDYILKYFSHLANKNISETELDQFFKNFNKTDSLYDLIKNRHTLTTMFFLKILKLIESDNYFLLGKRDMNLLNRIIKAGHTSTIEHVSYNFFVNQVSRALTHQLVRHRVASYSQESQRYVKVKDLHKNVVIPDTIKQNKDALNIFMKTIHEIQNSYEKLMELNIPKEDARYLLPNATYTSVVYTFNARSLRNFFKERLAKTAQWEIRNLANEMFKKLPFYHKLLFKDILENSD